MKGRIPERFIQDLLVRTDIVEIVRKFIPNLKKAGANFTACCPFHQEKTPSFSVSPEKQIYHCFGCGKGGDVIEFTREIQGIEFVEAIHWLADEYQMTMPEQAELQPMSQAVLSAQQVLTKAMQFYEQQLREHPAAEAVKNYLKKRGLTGQVAKQFHIGFAPPGWRNLQGHLGNDPATEKALIEAGLLIKNQPDKMYDRFRSRIIFPIFNQRNQVIAFGGRALGDEQPKYLNSPETALFDKSRTLYRSTLKQRTASIIVVEGYLDVIAFAQMGLHNVVATLGTAFTKHHFQQLFQRAPKVILCFDGDEAGQQAAWRALEVCLPLLKAKHELCFCMLPQGEDPDSLIRQHGMEKMQHLLDKSSKWSDFLFATLAATEQLGHVEGQIKFVAKVNGLVKKLTEPYMQELLLSRLAQIVGLDKQSLQSSKQAAVSKSNFSRSNSRVTNKQPIAQQPLLSPAIKACALLLHDPKLATTVHDYQQLKLADLLGTDLLIEMLALLQVNPSLTPQAIHEQLPADQILYFAPEEWKAYVQAIPVAGIEAEFVGAIKLVRSRANTKQADSLLSRAKERGSLSDEDKRLLQQIFATQNAD